jgi:hypothetical protein
MSEATRAIALTEAVKIGIDKGFSVADTIMAAGKLAAFLEADATVAFAATPTAAPAAAEPKKLGRPAKGEKPAAPAKAAAPAPAPEPEPEPEADAPAADAVTAQHVKEKITALVAANLRAQAQALLGNFGATSFSTLKAEDYAGFVNRADELLLAA